GLDLAIDAARLAGLPLRIAGPISNPGYFEQFIAPRLDQDVQYMGHLPHRELARLVGGALVALCTPRWEEPYGLVVAEALACGTPVAAFRRGGVPALLSKNCGVLAEPDNVASLASAALAASMLSRQACRAHAERYCDAQRMVDQYEGVYHDIAAAQACGGPKQAMAAPLVASVA
ncbi:hypothetical protein LTR94_027956, partial [Friedmanniomyces endolithicus]